MPHQINLVQTSLCKTPPGLCLGLNSLNGDCRHQTGPEIIR